MLFVICEEGRENALGMECDKSGYVSFGQNTVAAKRCFEEKEKWQNVLLCTTYTAEEY